MGEPVKVKVKKLKQSASIPRKATEGSAGFDLTVNNIKYDPKYKVWEYGCGLAFEIPKGYAGLLFMRSSVYKTGHSMKNSVGVIDCDFTGEIKAIFSDKDTPGYKLGNRFAQLVITPIPEIEFEEVSELSETERGSGGFGSTGK
jgi:dUTP pyrophosphatase